MSVKSFEPPKRKEVVIIGIIVGLLNALAWIILGSAFISSLGEKISIWWVLFCLILNISIAFAISRQRTRKFRRLYWITGVALFVTIVCAFISAFWAGYAATDSGGLAFFFGGVAGGIIGFLIGIIVGINTSPTRFSNADIIQRLGEGIVTSMIVGITISAMSAFILAVSLGLQDFVKQPDYYDLVEYVLFGVLLFTPAGAIPSVLNGITTTLIIYAVSWWLNRQGLIPNEGVG